MSREKWLEGWAAAHFLFFALLWALPAIYAGSTGKWVPRTPNEIENLSRAGHAVGEPEQRFDRK